MKRRQQRDHPQNLLKPEQIQGRAAAVRCNDIEVEAKGQRAQSCRGKAGLTWMYSDHLHSCWPSFVPYMHL